MSTTHRTDREAGARAAARALRRLAAATAPHPRAVWLRGAADAWDATADAERGCWDALVLAHAAEGSGGERAAGRRHGQAIRVAERAHETADRCTAAAGADACDRAYRAYRHAADAHSRAVAS